MFVYYIPQEKSTIEFGISSLGTKHIVFLNLFDNRNNSFSSNWKYPTTMDHLLESKEGKSHLLKLDQDKLETICWPNCVVTLFIKVVS